MPPPADVSHEELFASAQKLYSDNQKLSENNQKLSENNQVLEQELQRFKAQNEFLREQLKLSKQKEFGASSEVSKAQVAGQQTLPMEDLVFNEAEALVAPEAPEPTLETVVRPRRVKAKGLREAQLQHLPVEEIRYEVPESDRVCACCAHPLHPMGEEVRQEVKIVPAKASVVKHIQVVYACRHCAQHGTKTPIVTAPMPAPAFPGSLASPSAVAFVLSHKYELGLPLYRLEKHLDGLGIHLSRQNLANWVMRGANQLKPLFLKMREDLLARDALHADETPIQVLREPGRAATTDSFMWVYCSGMDGPPLVLFDYRETRSTEHPLKFLKGFGGYLHVDGYKVYEKLPGITLVGCWAHARRKFHEAVKTLTPASRAAGTSAAQQGLNFCNRLFKIESELREKTPEERFALRLERSQPVLDEMHAWLNTVQAQSLPKSALGHAVKYCLSQWPKLLRFLLDGRLELDNNRIERAIRPFAIGRKNWLFAKTPRGATSSAIVYSMVESAKANGLRPAAYLEYLFQNLPTIDAKDIHAKDTEALNALMPWNPEVQAACK